MHSQRIRAARDDEYIGIHPQKARETGREPQPGMGPALKDTPGRSTWCVWCRLVVPHTFVSSIEFLFRPTQMEGAVRSSKNAKILSGLAILILLMTVIVAKLLH